MKEMEWCFAEKKWAKSDIKKSEAINRNLYIYIMHYGGPGVVKNGGNR